MTVTDNPREQRTPPPYPVVPGVGVVDAVRRQWPVVLAPIVVLLIAAALIGSAQKPTYTAQARLNIGRLDVATQSIPGFAVGVQSLAIAYSRVVTSDGVVIPVAQKLGLTPGQVRSNVQGSPVALAPLIIVEAKAKTARGAVELVNAVSAELVTYLAKVNLENPDADRLLNEYKDQAQIVDSSSAHRRRLQQVFNDNPTPHNRDQLATATATLLQRQLRMEALRTSYLQSQAGANSASLVQLINPAKHARSDKRTHLEALLLGAFIAGLLIGVSLAVYRSNQALHRALLD
jgi:capsular polysaccharide biosynthesis protein